MFKLLLGLLGLVETLYPDRFIRVLTKYSYDYEGEAPTPKPWIISAARIEGLVILGVVVWSTIKSECSCGLLSRSETDDTESTDEVDSVVEITEPADDSDDSVDRID
jgi:hypothetical protein